MLRIILLPETANMLHIILLPETANMLRIKVYYKYININGHIIPYNH
jgi:hypothetical protein